MKKLLILSLVLLITSSCNSIYYTASGKKIVAFAKARKKAAKKRPIKTLKNKSRIDLVQSAGCNTY